MGAFIYTVLAIIENIKNVKKMTTTSIIANPAHLSSLSLSMLFISE